MKKIILFLIAFSLFSLNCINNVEDLSEPVPVPESVSYSNDVQPIFDNYCTDCHGGSGGISFENYGNTTSGNGNNYGASLIIPGDASSSGLIDKLGSNPRFNSQMPLNGSLTNQEIATITAWINEGALNN